MFKKGKKIICNVLAAIGVVACMGTFGACETQEPKVELEIEFNEKTYTLEYTLFRKITPTTVKHFLALVENGYYEGLCVHDYEEDSAMYTGAYTYNAADASLEYKDYYATVKDYLPQSVWLDGEKTRPTYTLYGEFEENEFKVNNGALQERFGALVMSYEKSGDNTDVYVERNDGDGLARRDYQENSATSQFYISLGTTVKNNDDYCVFATLTEEGVEELTALTAAIKAYVEAEYEDDSFTTRVSAETFDNVVGEDEKDYDMPKAPIVIKKATVIRY